MYSEIEDALNSGKLSKSRLDNAVLRIVQLKKDYGILDKKYYRPTDTDLKIIRSKLENPEFYTFKNKIKN